MELFSIRQVLGFGIFVEWLDYSASDSIIEAKTSPNERELWLFGRLHLVVSNERAYA